MPSWEWDAAQRAVVGMPQDASATVIGAPGTGKTSVLVERVAALVGSGTSAEEVLVVTPSRASATRLRDELGLRVAVASPGPLARSIGSLAFQIVRADAVRRRADAPRLLTGADQDRILAEILAGHEEDEAAGVDRWPAHLAAPVRASKGFRSELRAFLTELVELDVPARELRALGRETWTAVADLVDDYLNVLAGMRATHYDTAELYRLAGAVLREGASIPGLERLKTVLVDDAQELTRGGVALVEALRGRGVAVVAFGDPDIGSGAFRGATPELFARLAASLGAVRVLDGDHRSHPGISRLARSVTQAIGAGGRVDHRRAPGPEVDLRGAVETFRAGSPYEEADRIAWGLRAWHLDEGVPWDAMAVIAHDTRQLTRLEAELAAREVPTRAAGVQRPLGEQQAVREIVEIVRLGLQPAAERDPSALLDALMSPFGGLDGVGVRRLRARLRHAELAEGGNRPARELLREALAEPAILVLLDTPEARTAERFAVTLARLHELGRGGATVHELLWEAWDRSRAADGRRLQVAWRDVATSTQALAAETGRALDGLVALFDAAKRFVERSPQEGPLPFIREILDSDVPEDTLSSPERPGHVTLLTPASALGTEFDAVVIAGVQDGVWPNVRLRGGLLDTWQLPDVVSAARAGRETPDAAGALDRRRAALHDELRLFVRAVSRARARLLVTAVDDDDATPSALLSLLPAPPEHGGRTEHPLTLRGLVARHRRVLTSEASPDARREAAEQLAVLASEGVPGADPAQWYGVEGPSTTAPLVDAAERPVRVSPSRMETFETCGLDWAVRALGGDTQAAPSAGIGTILHAALEASPDGELDVMRAVLDDRWGELDFEAPWIERKERRRAEEYLGRLHAYLRRVRGENGVPLASEATFRVAIPLEGELRAIGVPEGGHVPEIGPHALVSGVIDRVERYPAGEGDHADARGRGWRPMSSEHPGAADHTVVVDLKTGKGEARLSDAKVSGDAQLAAYQLAVEEGLVPGADARSLAGARLVVVSQTTSRSAYRVAHQPALDAGSREEFLRRVREAARGMSASVFTAHVDTHCQGSHRPTLCRPHTVKPVSAS
ncbi:ATP-dependent DNA helicase [Microbacterium betulae]|uniref:DNA 3'-5' helicase n=1 Tax=Microbacterium betulae TaxID=2981139 RepID=A0AA97FN54_9MICO|nr:ATP-dependent DNA helicase [Microbacterium sp. AB]WOF24457.1 ATP-dependent DNA helicase [Microbacterium sp. AB]